MFKKKLPVIYLLLIPLACCVIAVAATRHILHQGAAPLETFSNIISETEADCNYSLERLRGYRRIAPLYLAEQQCESRTLLALKSRISAFAENRMSIGDVDEMSVYIKDLNSGSWIAYNPDAGYRPGSLFKVVTMITIFRMSEKEPELLEKSITYIPKPNARIPAQTFNNGTIKPGNTYKVKELVKHMIVNSDNHATMLLHDVADQRVYASVIADLGIPVPNSGDYTISVKTYSRFFSVIYDVGYLTLPQSEIAASLLSESTFNEGIKKYLPKNLQVADKFGETGKEGNKQFHESAIVYLANRPYLLTVMTKGKDARVLACVISEISKITYDHMLTTTIN